MEERGVAMNNGRPKTISLVIALGAASPFIGASEAISSSSPGSTAPQDDRAVAQPAIESYAADYGVSKDVAAERLDALGKMTSTAQAMRQMPEFGGFRVVTTDAGPEGQVALTSVTADAVGTIDDATGFRLFPARVPESELAGLSESLVKAAAPVTTLTAVMYDPFEDALTVWLPANSVALSADTEHALLKSVVAADPRLDSTVAIHTAITEDAEFLAG